MARLGQAWHGKQAGRRNAARSLLRKLAKKPPAKLLIEIPATYGVTVTLNPVAGPGRAKGMTADASFEYADSPAGLNAVTTQ